MMCTTVCLYVHEAKPQTGRLPTDFVEFYAGSSRPCRKTEFKKDKGLILQCAPDELSARAGVNLERMTTRM